jgi:hypothetical protein
MYEIKFNGFRALAYIEDGNCGSYSPTPQVQVRLETDRADRFVDFVSRFSAGSVRRTSGFVLVAYTEKCSQMTVHCDVLD